MSHIEKVLKDLKDSQNELIIVQENLLRQPVELSLMDQFFKLNRKIALLFHVLKEEATPKDFNQFRDDFKLLEQLIQLNRSHLEQIKLKIGAELHHLHSLRHYQMGNSFSLKFF